MVALTDLPRAHEPETVLHCADHLFQNIFVPQLGLFKVPLKPETETVLLAAVSCALEQEMVLHCADHLSTLLYCVHPKRDIWPLACLL